MKRVALILVLVYTALPVAAQRRVTVPCEKDSVRFAVIGDYGTGQSPEYDIAREMAAYQLLTHFQFVMTVGDNIYGAESPDDFRTKFEIPYKPLLDAGVTFHAALGNHDQPGERFYSLFNMNGRRYYSLRPKNGVRLIVLDSSYMDAEQLDWLQKELAESGNDWKICFFHHPLYSSGRTHGPTLALRSAVEPILIRSGARVVFSGHDHFYERIKPQSGIYYFISGAAGQLRRHNIRPTPLTEKGYDEDRHFMLVEIAGEYLYFQAISRTGITIDSGAISKPKPPD